jgi:hypothetical protein
VLNVKQRCGLRNIGAAAIAEIYDRIVILHFILARIHRGRMLFNKMLNLRRPFVYGITFTLVLLALLADGLLNSHLKSSIYFLPLTVVCLSA